MKKIIALITVVTVAACGNVSFDSEPCDVQAGEGGGGEGGMAGAGGASGSSSSGGSDPCASCFGDTRTGTRLIPLWMSGDDGSKMRAGGLWRDSLYNDETCSFTLLPNGENRCLPIHEKHNAFVDQNCAVPVYMQASGCGTVPRFILVDTLDAIDPGSVCAPKVIKSSLYSVEAEIPPWNMFYSRNADGQCTGKSLPPNARFFSIQPAPLISSFVSGFVNDGT